MKRMGYVVAMLVGLSLSTAVMAQQAGGITPSGGSTATDTGSSGSSSFVQGGSGRDRHRPPHWRWRCDWRWYDNGSTPKNLNQDYIYRDPSDRGGYWYWECRR